ncbi:LacI family DNA-binding transcriptional regulator [Verminephrobacter eiseniae]|nr:LacI family DNA-binding transcriptional regulator [Verminephrobacter eiseniae]MCW5295491.1 LacI family DNA-binding transcriptional regulator [Verminephrobacter eiseniae]MCW8185894.1 LacI family DNA-binding transcriptional regulator [Verminephrobacter eiseniae]MCW8223738.1 LacI family DNA-binding transcriptional regulator [Verminephrobacter eiseniae]MCW8232914.1 LacI family DNA-binding transcriptional regulator [Verminephrobacter eiseniae]
MAAEPTADQRGDENRFNDQREEASRFDMKPKADRPGIKDVATRAGVSLGSVSRVINKVENVSPELRQRVLHAIAELDYRLNHAAQTLRSRSSRTIGCMFTDVTNPLYANLYRIYEERFRADGYMVLLANSLNNPEWELEILSMFQSRRMDGIIIAPGNERNASVLAAVQKIDLPAVILDRDMNVNQDLVLFDHAPAVQQAMEHLIDQGHREIALVISGTQTRPMLRRIEGYQAGFAARGLPARADLQVLLPASTAPAFDLVRELLQRPVRPTALLTLGTSVLADVLNAIRAQGLRIPRDISVVSTGEPDFARSHQPRISSVTVDLDAAVRESTALLLTRIREGRTAAPRRVVVPTIFTLRGSCGPAPATAPRTR